MEEIDKDAICCSWGLKLDWTVGPDGQTPPKACKDHMNKVVGEALNEWVVKNAQDGLPHNQI